MRTALTIAGSDSGGGAGVQADLKSFQANGVFGMSAITAITAQNTQTVTAAMELPPDLITAQLAAVFDDLPVHAAKTGMLASATTVRCVAEFLASHLDLPLVVDPVMVSSTGVDLIDDDARKALVEVLFPLATVITPNAVEAARLLGRSLDTVDDLRTAARALAESGAAAVLVKGGHLGGEDSVDVLWDGASMHTFSAPRVDTVNTHGTGCTTAAAIAAHLAHGASLPDAVDWAKRYVHGAISAGLDLGAGHGPVDHFWFARGTRLWPIDGGDPR